MSGAVLVEQNVPTPMRDGTVLAADVYRPQGDGRHPVLLQRTPYDRTLPAVIGLMADPLRLAGAGYAVVVQDTRGRGDSEGEFHLFRDEIEDGYDTVEWCAAQSWADGKVGMFGVSYVGATQWLAALAAPPHLVTIMPALSPSGAYEGWAYRGGAFELGFNLSLTLLYFALESAPPERVPEVVAAIDDLCGGFRRLPVRDQPALAGVSPDWVEWLDHPDDDAYWRRWDFTEAYDRLEVPALHVGGWYDIFLDGTLRNFAGLQARGGQRLVVGPWSHGIPWLANPVGDVDFGYASTAVALGLESLQLRWCDHWLKGVDTGLLDEPPVRIFVMGENAWRDEHEWPLARTRWTDWFLRAGGVLATEPPGAEPPDGYTYDPNDPVPTLGGALCCSPGHTRGGAFDQRPVEARPDVLVYSTPPLAADLEATGPLRVVLWASTSAPGTDWTAKLVDVEPDGFARNLADGIVRTGHREPGAVHEVEIDLAATSNLFRAGHRIRLEVSSSNFPRFDRSLSGAEQRIHHDIEHPSRIVLPVIDRDM